MSRLESLDKKKQTELRELKTRELEVAHKDKGLAHFQAIVDYYTYEEGDAECDTSRPNGSAGKDSEQKCIIQ